jgi:hypothetical protein
MQTVLDAATKADVKSDPFPHVIIRNALPDDYYSALSQAFPKLTDLPPSKTKGNNKRVDLLSSWGPATLGNNAPDIWKQFIADHCSDDFRLQVFNLFPLATDGSGMIRTEIFGSDLLYRLEVDGPIKASEITGRATLAANTPVETATSVRGPHVDAHRKAYVGLYYLRHEDDDSEGGDLSLHRVKPGHRIEPWADKVSFDDVDEIGVVKYAPNTLVMMLNTSNALHGVTVRKPTPHMRRLVVVSGWFPGKQTERFAALGAKAEDQY